MSGEQEDRNIIEVRAGAEVVLVIKDPYAEAALWLRGYVEEGRVTDSFPSRAWDPFTRRRFGASHASIVDPERIRFIGVLRARTFTLGWPSPEQLAKPIPLEFDPDYFRRGP
jgi:hypothetical protein